MRTALEYARTFGIPVANHCEEMSLAEGGAMQEGLVSTRLGLKGIPAAAEEIMVARDIILAELTGGHVHLCHMSTRGSVELIRRGKEKGIRVTAEATPHHFSLTHDRCAGYDTNAKMNPPLRSAEDVAAIRAGLADGTIDAIATDHAPHHLDEKNVEFNIALNGIVGLETALPLTLRLVEDGVLPLKDAIARLTIGPARALGLPRGTLEAGAAADITVIDPELKWTVAAKNLLSKSKNTPFDDWKMKGAATHTIVGGKIVWKRE
jgi:dihydroorotase